jgi:hypothetical protein
MSTINVNSVIDNFSRTAITLNSSGRPTIRNLQPNIIHRNGNDAGPSLITLSSFNEVHVYTSGVYNSQLFIRTSLVSGALYEMWIMAEPGTANVDPGFYPNATSYTGEFATSYRSTQQADGTFIRRIETTERFWFDHQNGGAGTAPMMHIIFSTGPTNKYMQFEGADTGPSLSTGYGRWTNDTRTWDWFGYIDFSMSSSFKRAWLRRIG